MRTTETFSDNAMKETRMAQGFESLKIIFTGLSPTFLTLTIICLIIAAFGIYSIKRSAVADSGAFGAILIVVAVLVWVGALLIMPA